MSKPRISYERLRELVNYDPETGIMTRKVRTSNRVHVGDVVGTTNAMGYRIAWIGGHYAYVHQFAWLYVKGVWPTADIDHCDQDKQNNKFANLREATDSQNLSNVGIRKHNTSGFKGVWKKRGKWCAEIKANRQKHYLGVFDDPAEAHAAYCLAADRLHGEFARVV